MYGYTNSQVFIFQDILQIIQQLPNTFILVQNLNSHRRHVDYTNLALKVKLSKNFLLKISLTFNTRLMKIPEKLIWFILDISVKLFDQITMISNYFKKRITRVL